MLEPEDCRTMIDVRAGVDAVDAELVRLLRRRFGYMDAAARIKPVRSHVRDEPRKAQVIANVRGHAREVGLPEERLARIWDRLIEESIAYEFEAFDALAPAEGAQHSA